MKHKITLSYGYWLKKTFYYNFNAPMRVPFQQVLRKQLFLFHKELLEIGEKYDFCWKPYPSEIDVKVDF